MLAGHSTEGREACGVSEEPVSFGEGEGSAHHSHGRVSASRGEGEKAASPLRDFVLKYVDSCSGKEFKGVFYTSHRGAHLHKVYADGRWVVVSPAHERQA